MVTTTVFFFLSQGEPSLKIRAEQLLKTLRLRINTGLIKQDSISQAESVPNGRKRSVTSTTYCPSLYKQPYDRICTDICPAVPTNCTESMYESSTINCIYTVCILNLM